MPLILADDSIISSVWSLWKAQWGYSRRCEQTYPRRRKNTFISSNGTSQPLTLFFHTLRKCHIGFLHIVDAWFLFSCHLIFPLPLINSYHSSPGSKQEKVEGMPLSPQSLCSAMICCMYVNEQRLSQPTNSANTTWPNRFYTAGNFPQKTCVQPRRSLWF